MAGGPLDFFPPGFAPRPEQVRLLRDLGEALEDAAAGARAAHLLLVEAPPGVGKSHVAMALARWSGDAYLLTSQKLLQDQYEREFGSAVQIVKGRDNYVCERYPGARVPTSQGMCRRPRGPACHCPYARAKAAALGGPVFCTNTSYFATLWLWRPAELRRRRLLIVDEAHHLESQLVSALIVDFPGDRMRAWFGAPLPHLPSADDYRPLLAGHRERLELALEAVERELAALAPPPDPAGDVLTLPPLADELALLARRDELEDAVARLRVVDAVEDREWVVRYPPGGTFELVPLAVEAEARALLDGCAEAVVLLSGHLGPPLAVAGELGVDEDRLRAFRSASPFPLDQRRIVFRPVGALSRARQAELEPRLFAGVAAILAEHADEKGLVHAPSYAAGARLVRDLATRTPAHARRLIWIHAPGAKADALERHRASPVPTVLVSPSLREGVDLPDDFLRFQVVTKMPFPDLGDPWIAARRLRDPRWYALETAKALVQAYGRSCRHAGDHGVTYVLDGHFAGFVQRNRALLPPWFLEAADAALRGQREAAEADVAL